jgi:hypothetical protein
MEGFSPSAPPGVLPNLWPAVATCGRAKRIFYAIPTELSHFCFRNSSYNSGIKHGTPLWVLLQPVDQLPKLDIDRLFL